MDDDRYQAYEELTKQDVPDVEIPQGATVVEEMASGKPAVSQSNGEKYYHPDSTMYKLGFRTESEYNEAQHFGSSHGLHEGSLVPENTVILMEGDKPSRRYTQDELSKQDQAAINEYYERGAIKVPKLNEKGKETLLSISQVKKIADAKDDKEIFKLYKQFGVISHKTPYISKSKAAASRKAAELSKFESQQFKKNNTQLPDGKWISNKDLAEYKKESPEIYTLLKNSGFNAANEYINKQNAVASTNIVESVTDAVKSSEDKGLFATIKNIYRNLTPWDEDAGETYIAYMKKYPERLKASFLPAAKTQEELKTKYDNYQKQPLWAKALFGSPHIIYDKKKDTYIEFAAGEAPMISGAGGKEKLAKTATKVIEKIVKEASKESKVAEKVTEAAKTTKKLKTIEINWNKILEDAEKAKKQADWDKVWGSIKQTVSKEQDRAALKNSKLSIARIKESLDAAQAKKAADLIKKQAESQKNKELLQRLIKPVSKEDIAARERIGTINKQIQAELAKIRAKPNTKIRLAVLPTISEKIAAETTTATGTATQTELQQMAKAREKAATLLSTAVVIATQTLPANATQTQIEQAIQEAVDVQLKTQVKPKEVEQVKEAIDTITKETTTTKTTTPSKTVAPAKASEPPVPGKPVPQPTPSKPPTPGKPPDRIRHNGSGHMTDRQLRQLVKDSEGVIAFRLGTLAGKDQWRVYIPPYGEENRRIIRGRKPVGVKHIVKGPESAYETAQVISGPSIDRKFIDDDIGFMRAVFEPLDRKRGVKLTFEHDPKISGKKPFPLG